MLISHPTIVDYFQVLQVPQRVRIRLCDILTCLMALSSAVDILRSSDLVLSFFSILTSCIMDSLFV